MERRLSAILAADVVGYSRLMGKDEAGTLEALKAHRADLIDPNTAQYGGRTIKLMGDGILMEFASVVDAVAFAVEVQSAMRERNAGIPEDRQIIYRIGINVGDIIVEGEDIYGDGVNVAASLQEIAGFSLFCPTDLTGFDREIRAARSAGRGFAASHRPSHALPYSKIGRVSRPSGKCRLILNQHIYENLLSG